MTTKHDRRVAHGKVDSASAGQFSGRANQFDVVDASNEIVRRGAATKSIRERGNKLPVLIKHFANSGDVADAVALTTQIEERPDGLWIRAKYLADAASQKIRLKVAGILKAGGRVGLSIGYRLLKWHNEMVKGKAVRVLDEIALMEITLTLRPANEGSYISSAKDVPDAEAMRAKVRVMACRAKIEEEVRIKMAAEKLEAKLNPEHAATSARYHEMKARIAAKATDHAGDERIRAKIIERVLFGGRSMSGRERDALTPKSKTFADVGDNAMVLPDSLAAGILGAGWARCYGKALSAFPDLVANPSFSDLLIPAQQMAPFARSPLAQPALHELVTVVNTAGAQVLTVPGIVSGDGAERNALILTWGHDQGGIAKNESEPVFSGTDIATNLLSGICHLSERAAKQPGTLNLLASLFRDAVDVEFARVILNGAGTTSREPFGIIGSAGLRTVARAVAGQVVYADLVGLKYAIRPSARRNSRWLTADAVLLGLEGRVTASSAPEAGASFDADRSSLIGIKHRAEDDSPSIGETGDVLLGDPRAYVLALESEFVVRQSHHFKFRENQVSISYATGVGGRLARPRSWAILDSAGS